MVKPLMSALIVFTPETAWASSNGIIKILASSMNKGAPGGCGTSSLKALEANSPQSQKLPVASIVDK